MIERQTIDGREATIAYYTENFEPTDDLGAPHYAKVLFDDGEMIILRSSAPDPNSVGERKRRARVWQDAIGIIDATETQVRDIIERGLANVAGKERLRYHEAMLAAKKVSAEIEAVRTAAFKRAFRLIRDEGLS